MTLDDLTTLKEFASSIGYEILNRDKGFGIKFPNTNQWNTFIDYSNSAPDTISIAPYSVHLFDESSGYKLGYYPFDLKKLELKAVKNMLNKTMESKKEYMLNKKVKDIESDFLM
jgi:hypothetical protein